MSDFVFTPIKNNGAIFNTKEKRTPNWPDVFGEIFMSRDLMETLLQQEGELIKISVSGWRKQAKTGTKYLSLSVSQPYEKKTESQKQEPQDDKDVPF